MIETVILIVAILLMIAGFLGIILPFLPDLILIFSAILLYAIFDGFQKISPTMVVIFGIFVVFSFFADYLTILFGAKKFGASFAGIAGAIFGLISGILIPGFIFIIIMPIVGAIIGELISGKQWRDAARVGVGSFLGYFFSAFVKIILAAIMIAWFIKVTLQA